MDNFRRVISPVTANGPFVVVRFIARSLSKNMFIIFGLHKPNSETKAAISCPNKTGLQAQPQSILPIK